MSATNKGRRKLPGAKKPPPRWRKYLVQAELELPPPLAGSSAEGGAGEAVPLPWWQTRAGVVIVAACCALLLIATGMALYRASIDRDLVEAANARAEKLTVRASTTERDLRIAPNPRSWSATPDLALIAPEPPEMLNLFFPVGYTDYLAFAVTIDKVDHGRVLTVQRMSPDSNRDLRLALNSSAFGPGEYRFRLQGYTWRGDRVDAGWVRMSVTASAP